MQEQPSLAVSQLYALDAIVTRAQIRGKGPSDRFKTDPTDITTGLADAHHPLFDLSEHDAGILRQMVELASQLELETSIDELLEIRGRLVQQLGGA